MNCVYAPDWSGRTLTTPFESQNLVSRRRSTKPVANRSCSMLGYQIYQRYGQYTLLQMMGQCDGYNWSFNFWNHVPTGKNRSFLQLSVNLKSTSVFSFDPHSFLPSPDPSYHPLLFSISDPNQEASHTSEYHVQESALIER